MRSSDEGISLLGVVSEGWGQSLGASVVSRESVDSGLDQNQSELAVFVGSELLDVLSDVDSLLDQVVQVFGD